MNEARDARDWQVGELGERLLEQHNIARKECPQNQAGRELPGHAQVADERADFRRRAVGGDGDRSLLASLARDALSVIVLEPGTPGDEAGERLRQFGNQGLPRCRRKVIARQQRLADRGEMTEAFDNAIGRRQRDVGIAIFDEHQAGFRGADFGDCGCDRARQRRAARNRGLDRRTAGRHRLDQIGIDE